MLTIEEIKKKMSDRRVDLVAKGAGINKQTLYMIMWGKKKPSYDTLEKLTNYFAKD